MDKKLSSVISVFNKLQFLKKGALAEHQSTRFFKSISNHATQD
jgi:hypothetical protein